MTCECKQVVSCDRTLNKPSGKVKHNKTGYYCKVHSHLKPHLIKYGENRQVHRRGEMAKLRTRTIRYGEQRSLELAKGCKQKCVRRICCGYSARCSNNDPVRPVFVLL